MMQQEIAARNELKFLTDTESKKMKFPSTMNLTVDANGFQRLKDEEMKNSESDDLNANFNLKNPKPVISPRHLFYSP